MGLDGQIDVLVAYGETADRAEQDDKAPAPARPLLRVEVTIAVQRPAAPREPNKEKKAEPRPFPRS